MRERGRGKGGRGKGEGEREIEMDIERTLYVIFIYKMNERITSKIITRKNKLSFG